MQDLIRLQLRGPASPRPVPVLVDAGLKISGQLQLFLRKLGLTPKPGEPPYDLHHAEGKSILDPALSFREAGVRENHVLVLLPRAAPPPEPKGPPIDESQPFRPYAGPPPRVPPSDAVVALEKAVEEVHEGRRSEFELENLLPAAQAGAVSARDKVKVLGVIRRFGLEGAIPWVAAQLRDAGADVRELAVKVFFRLQAEDRLEELRPLLADPAGKVRGEAAAALARFDWEESAERILALLEDPDPAARTGAARALEKMPVKGREGRLLRLLDDRDEHVRAAAVDALAAVNSPALGTRVNDLLRDPSEQVRSSACRAAGERRLPAAIPLLLECLEKDPPVAEAAMEALVDLDAREATDLLRARLGERQPWDQRRALDALTRLGTVEKRDVDRFGTRPDSLVRGAVLSALHHLKATAELAPFLADEDPKIQVQACTAVAGPEEIRRLRDFLSHRDPQVRADAAHGLALHRVQDVGGEITPLLLDADHHVRAEAVQCLERLEYLPAARSIAALAGDDQIQVRLMAFEALRVLAAPEVCGELLPHLSHRLSRVRRFPLLLLQEFDARDAIPAIVRLLRDPVPVVRASAAVRLAMLGAESSTPEIRSLLSDPRPSVRWAAATAIASFGDRGPVREALDPGREPESLDFALLNGAREPILWKRLRDTRVARDYSGTPAEIVAALAGQAGVAVDMAPELRGRPLRPPGEVVPIRARSRKTLLTQLRQTAGEKVDLLLEPGRIRLVPQRDAIAEWMAWIG